MVKAGKVFATATEDMDALTFGCNILLRRLTFSEARKMPVQEFHQDKVLEGLELSHDEVCKNNDINIFVINYLYKYTIFLITFYKNVIRRYIKILI